MQEFNTILKKLLVFIFFFAFSTSFNSYGSTDYDWDGDVSTSWETGQNWNASPGTIFAGDDSYGIDGDEYDTSNRNPEITSSTTFGYLIENININDNGKLTITNNTVTATVGILIQDRSDLIIGTGAIVNTINMSVIDNQTHVLVNGGTVNLSGDLALGNNDALGNNNGTNGSPTVTLSSGFLNCRKVIFDNETGDTSPKLVVSGGILTTTGNIESSGNPVDITISGTGKVVVSQNIIGGNSGVNITIEDSGILEVLGDFESDGTVNIAVSSGGTLDITGSVDMNATFNMTSGSIYIEENWANLGTNNMTGGTVVFNGVTSQSFNTSSESGATFYNLEFPNASNVSLNTPITVSNMLTFNGVIDTDWTNTLKFGNGATFSQANSSSYINGPIHKSGTEAFTFPLSRPISISAPASTTEFAAEYIGSSPAGSYSLQSREEAIDHVSSIEHWILNRTSGSSGVAVTLHWDTNSDVGEAEDLADLMVVRWDGSQWVSHGGTASGTPTAGTITSSTVSNFSPFTFGSSSEESTLPVSLTGFSAKLLVNGNVELAWETATETNNSHFEIQRSNDGEEFETIAKIYSQEESGNSNKPLYYSTTDHRPIAGTSYYRLKQLDFDGTYKIYPYAVIQNEFENTTYKVVYPNPILNNEVFVRIEGAFESADFSLLDSQGMPIHSKTSQEEENTFQIIPTSTLGPGYYFLKINVINKGKVESSSHKLIVK